MKSARHLILKLGFSVIFAWLSLFC